MKRLQDVERGGFTTEVEDKVDQEAWRLSANDMALWFHHRALLTGEFFMQRRSAQEWRSYLRTKELAQYAAVEQSVIQAWRTYVNNTAGLPPGKQTDPYAVNCVIVLDALRRKRGSDQLREVFKRRSHTFHVAAERGDLEFFRAVGRLLSETEQSGYLKRFEYVHGMLWRWLTESYWLLPAKIASQLVATGLGVPDSPKTFLAIKSRYGLKSHKPSLIDRLEKVDDQFLRVVLTKRGKLLLG